MKSRGRASCFDGCALAMLSLPGVGELFESASTFDGPFRSAERNYADEDGGCAFSLAGSPFVWAEVAVCSRTPGLDEKGSTAGASFEGKKNG